MGVDAETGTDEDEAWADEPAVVVAMDLLREMENAKWRRWGFLGERSPQPRPPGTVPLFSTLSSVLIGSLVYSQWVT